MWFSWSIDHLHNFGAQNFIVKIFWHVSLIEGGVHMNDYVSHVQMMMASFDLTN